MSSARIGVRGALLCAAVVLVGTEQWALAQSAGIQSSGGASPFDTLRFRPIGPATMAGRIDDFAVLESDPATFYMAAATGGLWKTTNNGTTFETVFDDESTSSIGDVAIASTDANLVWVGTGENNNRQSSSWGEGVFKSTDGGKSWANMGAQGFPPHRARRHRPGGSRRCLRGGARQPVGGRRRAGRLRDDGRRRHLGSLAGGGRGHRCHRPPHGPDEQQGPVRGDLPAAALGVGLQRRRAGQRDLQVARRRRELDGADRGPARGPKGTDRARHLPQELERPLRADRAPR